MERRRTVFTYEDYKLLPEDGYRWEVLDGNLVREPAPRPFHQIVADNLFRLLDEHVRSHHLGIVIHSPLDIVLSDENVVQPDLIFIPTERFNTVTEENVSGAPALAVEVLSPSTGHRDRVVKRKIYERFGVREYWIVDPQRRTVEVLALGDEGYRLHGAFTKGDVLRSPLFPGLSIEVREVFHNPLFYS